ncbi:NlpC/P60 family protein [Alkalibacterium subtropicum]|uniref:C40 family peptidase n=1 Tax=Alkalibacterium subtropicum TaxID=753702 RepID=UPI0015A5015E|nr:NlpC/P60 family protein [Alkalibacterium subtropicum]
MIEATPSEAEYTEKMTELESREENAQEELASIVTVIEETEAEAEKLVDDMEETVRGLERIQEEIAVLSHHISQRETRLKAQIRSVQVSGRSSEILNFLIEAESLSDILARLGVVNTLFSANHELMTSQIEDQEEVRKKEQRTIEIKEEQLLLAAELETKKAELDEKRLEQESLVAAIAAEKSVVEEERAAYLAQQQRSERRLQALQTARTSARSAESVTDSVSGGTDETVSSSSSQNNDPASGAIVRAAHSLTGVRYSYGGSTTSGFDCSGFTQFALRKAGESIPRTAAAQFGASRRLAQSEARPGDLIFFNQSGYIDHVGIYLGGGKFIGAQTSTGVAVASFTTGYWSRYVAGFGRP